VGAERVRKAIESLSLEIKQENGQTEKIEITISIGVAEYPYDANTADSLVDVADLALYDAKRLGCNRVIRYYPKQR
jgi:diguanylate cyclase (GGDEF)-like protein